jgi:hypothetical protein
MPQSLIDRLHRDKTLKLDLKVIPKSSRNEIAGLLENGSLKVKITAAPEKGKANAAICTFLAKEFSVPKNNVRIVRGQTSPNKHVVIDL